MNLRRAAAIVALALVCTAAQASAQQTTTENPFRQDVQGSITEGTARHYELPSPNEIPAPQQCTASTTLCQAYESYRTAYFSRLERLGEIQVRQYQKQMAYSDWIMFIVLLLVFGGFAFSGAQLWVALKTGKSVNTGDIDATIGQQIVVKTSAMGISVLTISLIFFYLLLQQVYTIVPANAGARSAIESASTERG